MELEAKIQEVAGKQLQVQKTEEECQRLEQVVKETKASYMQSILNVSFLQTESLRQLCETK